MTAGESRQVARRHLAKAREYLAAARDSLSVQRHTVAAGDAIHAGICAKDAIVTALTGTTRKGRDHATAATELRVAMGSRAAAPTAERALRELISAKSGVEYGTDLVSAVLAERLVRRATALVDAAGVVVDLGG